jgi:hypothetical protein
MYIWIKTAKILNHKVADRFWSFFWMDEQSLTLKPCENVEHCGSRVAPGFEAEKHQVFGRVGRCTQVTGYITVTFPTKTCASGTCFCFFFRKHHHLSWRRRITCVFFRKETPLGTPVCHPRNECEPSLWPSAWCRRGCELGPWIPSFRMRGTQLAEPQIFLQGFSDASGSAETEPRWCRPVDSKRWQAMSFKLWNLTPWCDMMLHVSIVFF